MDLFEAMFTQRAIRRFSPEPVPDELLRRVLDAAIHAPSGGNNQSWNFVVITDSDVKSQVGRIYKQAWDDVGLSRFANDPDASRARIYRSADYLAERMGDAPVLLLACIEGSSGSRSLATGASIYPAVQNLMLAARGLGLGTVITTVHKHRETEMKELVGIPDEVETAALIPMGYPEKGTRFGPTTRKPIEQVTFRNHWAHNIEFLPHSEI